jgi:hypothetical protein
MTKLFILRGLLDLVYYSSRIKFFWISHVVLITVQIVLKGENVVVAYYAS